MDRKWQLPGRTGTRIGIWFSQRCGPKMQAALLNGAIAKAETHVVTVLGGGNEERTLGWRMGGGRAARRGSGDRAVPQFPKRYHETLFTETTVIERRRRGVRLILGKLSLNKLVPPLFLAKDIKSPSEYKFIHRITIAAWGEEIQSAGVALCLPPPPPLAPPPLPPAHA